MWTKSKSALPDLDRKTVEFRIPTQRGVVHAVGEFWVRQNPEGLLAVDLVTDVQGQDWAQRIQTRYSLPQEAVDRIERHPTPSVADFRLG
jgi:hypothetical protein